MCLPLIMRIFVFIRIGNFSDDTARNTNRNDTRRNILCYDTAGTYNRIITNCYTAKNGSSCTYPYIISDGYRQCNLKSLVALLNIKRMLRRCKQAIGGNKNMITECYFSAIENLTIMICKEVM